MPTSYVRRPLVGRVYPPQDSASTFEKTPDSTTPPSFINPYLAAQRRWGNSSHVGGGRVTHETELNLSPIRRGEIDSRGIKSKQRNIGARIKEARKKAGLKQYELARVVGISKPYMSQIESGRRKPSRELFFRFSQALNVTLSYLSGLKNDGFQMEMIQSRVDIADVLPLDIALEKFTRIMEGLFDDVFERYRSVMGTIAEVYPLTGDRIKVGRMTFESSDNPASIVEKLFPDFFRKKQSGENLDGISYPTLQIQRGGLGLTYEWDLPRSERYWSHLLGKPTDIFYMIGSLKIQKGKDVSTEVFGFSVNIRHEPGLYELEIKFPSLIVDRSDKVKVPIVSAYDANITVSQRSDGGSAITVDQTYHNDTHSLGKDSPSNQILEEALRKLLLAIMKNAIDQVI